MFAYLIHIVLEKPIAKSMRNALNKIEVNLQSLIQRIKGLRVNRKFSGSNTIEMRSLYDVVNGFLLSNEVAEYQFIIS